MCVWQGGLLVRALAEAWTDHRIVHLVTMAGVLNGFYGCPAWLRPYIGAAVGLATDLLYTDLAQTHFSVANYWKTPVDHARYVEHCQFLPQLSNEVRLRARALPFPFPFPFGQGRRSKMMNSTFLELPSEI